MPSESAHATCTNLLVKGNGLSFHRFPKDHGYRMRWIFLMRRSEGWLPKSWDSVCSSHFKDEDFDRTGQTVRLRDNVEPSVFAIPEHLRKTPKARTAANSNRKRAASPDVHIADDCNSWVVEMDTAVQSFHNYAAPSEESYKEKWLRVDSRVDDLERRLHNALQREKRTKLTVLSLVEELKEKNLLTEDLQSRLDAYSDFPIHLFKKTTEYTNEQKNFAMTLHLYGPKAYDYLAKKVNLPSPRTLRRWLSKTDGTPGLNSTMLQALKEKVIKDPSTFTDVALMLDAMSIRKQIIYDSREKKMTGFVDLGDNNENEDEASEALVFMVVGFKGHWKAPIAYYLTKSLHAPTQQELVVHSLNALHDIGMRVWTITMDGHGTNQSMCKSLGCDMSVGSCSPKFKHPADPSHMVFVMFDPCHMLKLFRNLLSAYGFIVSENGKVQWDYIKRLQTLQDDAGLRLANKLSQRHTAPLGIHSVPVCKKDFLGL